MKSEEKTTLLLPPPSSSTRQQQPHLTKPIAIVNQCLKQKAITKQKTIEEDIIHCVKESLAGNYIKTYKQKQNE